MRSEIVKKILSETSEETRDKVRTYGNKIVMDHDQRKKNLEIMDRIMSMSVIVDKLLKEKLSSNDEIMFGSVSIDNIGPTLKCMLIDACVGVLSQAVEEHFDLLKESDNFNKPNES